MKNHCQNAGEYYRSHDCGVTTGGGREGESRNLCYNYIMQTFKYQTFFWVISQTCAFEYQFGFLLTGIYHWLVISLYVHILVHWKLTAGAWIYSKAATVCAKGKMFECCKICFMVVTTPWYVQQSLWNQDSKSVALDSHSSTTYICLGFSVI